MFLISFPKELKYIGPWKLTEKCLNISSTDRKVKIIWISSIMVTELVVKTKYIVKP